MIDFVNSLGSADMQSLINCLNSYRDYAFREEVEEVGFNQSSGYVYVYLTNGVCIASSFGQDVTYIKSNFESGEEDFYNSYYNCLHEIKEDEEDI